MGAINSIAEQNTVYNTRITKRLGLLLGKDSLFYLVIDNAHVVSSFQQWTKNQRNILYTDWVIQKLQEDRTLQDLVPDQIHLSILSNQFTLVPVAHYDENFSEIFLRRNVPIPDQYVCQVDSVTTRDYIKVVYAVPSPVQRIKQYLGNQVKISHIMGHLIRLGAGLPTIDFEWSILIWLRGFQQSILVFKEGKLQFANVFSIQADEDFYYYLGLVLTQLKIKPADATVWIGGDLSEKQSKYQWLKKRCKHLRWIELTQETIVATLQRQNVKVAQLADLLSLTQ